MPGILGAAATLVGSPATIRPIPFREVFGTTLIPIVGVLLTCIAAEVLRQVHHDLRAGYRLAWAIPHALAYVLVGGPLRLHRARMRRVRNDTAHRHAGPPTVAQEATRHPRLVA